MFTQAIDHTNDWIMERDRNKFVVVFDFLCDGIVLIINRTRTNILMINIKIKKFLILKNSDYIIKTRLQLTCFKLPTILSYPKKVTCLESHFGKLVT
ncbi:hypothetical protein HanPSC8_Chr08g0307601 [Helianthus annuus]|nr:hypothetical protein HanPSC8_Chr08g0307601 [Helianthus annuus]